MDILRLLRAHADRAAALGGVLLGAIALWLGYRGVSGTPFPAEQLPYFISGGITGIFLLGVAGTLYVSADLRDEWRKLDDIDQRLAVIEHELTENSAGPKPSEGVRRVDGATAESTRRPTSKRKATATTGAP